MLISKIVSSQGYALMLQVEYENKMALCREIEDIFLYEAVENDNMSGKKYSVSSMLSEVHNNMIHHWLAIW